MLTKSLTFFFRWNQSLVDEQSAKLGAKIRKAENDKIPHICIIGKREAEEEKISRQEIIQSSMEP